MTDPSGRTTGVDQPTPTARRRPLWPWVAAGAGAAVAVAVAVAMMAGGGPAPVAAPPPALAAPAGLTPSGQEAGVGEETPALTAVKVGTPFDAEITYSDGAPDHWQVTVRDLACGIARIPKGASNPKWAGDDRVPRLIDAAPPAGQVFCEVSASVKNLGRAPGSLPSFGDVVLESGEFAASGDDDEISDNLTTAAATVNPGRTVTVRQVWTVPVGSRAVGVLFPAATLVSGPSHRIEL